MLKNLTYAQYRAVAKDGDVIFLHGTRRAPIQALIMFFTGSVYCHVAIAFWVTINHQRRLMVVENQGGTRRRILSASYYKDRTFDVFRAPVPWHDIADEALSKVGEAKYGYFDAVYVGLREYFWNRWGIRLPAFDYRGEICSEFVARLLKIDPPDMSPGVLSERIRVLFPDK